MLVSKRVVRPFSDPRWEFELKWDGYRAIVTISNGRFVVMSRNANDLTDRFPSLAGLQSDVHGHEVVKDGEIVVFDKDGNPDFLGVA